MSINMGKLYYAMLVILISVFSAGSYLGIRNLFVKNSDANVVNASTKTYQKDANEKPEEKLRRGKTHVYENDDTLVITGTEVDVSGMTYKEISEMMRREAEKNGGIRGE